MNARVNDLLHEALGLTDEERSALVAALIDSLQGSSDPSISQAWRDEVRARREAVRNGTVQPVPWAEARARLDAL
jgi:putative addiction module component (TIGR02574 family)